jgi:simple sugar transport system permease protein
MTLAIATGGVDLSVGSVLAVTAALSIVLVRGPDVTPTLTTSMAIPLVIIITLIAGIACGVWNGLLIGKIGMPPVVATLILMVAGRGLTQLVTSERSVTTGYDGFRALTGGTILGFPNQIWIAIGVFILFWIITRKTAFGLYIESVGANKSAATYSGIKSTRIIIIIYALSGFCAAIAGILFASENMSVAPMVVGQNRELDAIVAVVLGGTSMKGGKFNLGGTVIGAITMMALFQTLVFYGIPPQFNLAVQATVIFIIIIIQSPITHKFISTHFGKTGNMLKTGSGKTEEQEVQAK